MLVESGGHSVTGCPNVFYLEHHRSQAGLKLWLEKGKKKGVVTGIRQERDVSVYFRGLAISFLCAETRLCSDLIFASPGQGHRATLPSVFCEMVCVPRNGRPWP